MSYQQSINSIYYRFYPSFVILPLVFVEFLDLAAAAALTTPGHTTVTTSSRPNVAWTWEGSSAADDARPRLRAEGDDTIHPGISVTKAVILGVPS